MIATIAQFIRIEYPNQQCPNQECPNDAGSKTMTKQNVERLKLDRLGTKYSLRKDLND